jgi:hypothetical protein
MSAQIASQKKGSGFLNGIDEKGTWLAKFFAKICTYGLAYAVIYLAIQMSLPSLRNGIVYGVAMTIVFAAPELMIGGLAVEAMEKFKENKPLGSFLFIVAVLFLSIGILTMVDIFFWHFKDGDPGQQMLSLYRAVVVIFYSAVHGIVSKLNEQREEKVQQVAQANDTLALENRQQIDKISLTLESVHSAYTDQQKSIQTLGGDVQKLADSIQNSVHTVDTGIDTRIEQLAVQVTEINQNIVQITQNNQYNLPERAVYTRPYTPQTPPVEDYTQVSESTYVVEEVPDSTQVATIESTPAIPLLDVPGASQERITSVLTLVKNGMTWTAAARELRLNPTRDVKPIRLAYEEYQASRVHTS